MSRYSQLYLERGAPQADSVRVRRRLAAFAERFRPQSTAEFNAAKKLKAKLGLQFQSDARAVQEVFTQANYEMFWMRLQYYTEIALVGESIGLTMSEKYFPKKKWLTELIDRALFIR